MTDESSNDFKKGGDTYGKIPKGISAMSEDSRRGREVCLDPGHRCSAGLWSRALKGWPEMRQARKMGLLSIKMFARLKAEEVDFRREWK